MKISESDLRKVISNAILNEVTAFGCNKHSLGYIDAHGSFLDISADEYTSHEAWLSSKGLYDWEPAQNHWIKLSNANELTVPFIHNVSQAQLGGLVNMWLACKDYSLWIKNPESSYLNIYNFDFSEYEELTIPEFIEKHDKTGEMMEKFFGSLLSKPHAAKRSLNEISTLQEKEKEGYQTAMLDSRFWLKSNSINDVDLVSDTEHSSPAIEVLMDALNNEAERQNSELYFLLEASDEEMYALSPDDQYGGYPNNWMMRGMYQGPMAGKHVIYLQFRALDTDYNHSDLDYNKLVGIISRTINHELVHYYQLKKQAESKGISDEEAWEELVDDKKQISSGGGRANYLGLHNEIDAYAHEAAEELLNTHGLDKALDVLRYQKTELTPIIQDYITYLGDDKRKLDSFLSKVYTQINDMTSKNN